MTRTACIVGCLLSLLLVSQVQAQVPPGQSGNAVSGPPTTSTPKQGRPLDPRDVDILTGKADVQRRALNPSATPYLLLDGPVTFADRPASLAVPGVTSGFPVAPGFLPFLSHRSFRVAPPFRRLAAPPFAPFNFRGFFPRK